MRATHRCFTYFLLRYNYRNMMYFPILLGTNISTLLLICRLGEWWRSSLDPLSLHLRRHATSFASRLRESCRTSRMEPFISEYHHPRQCIHCLRSFIHCNWEWGIEYSECCLRFQYKQSFREIPRNRKMETIRQTVQCSVWSFVENNQCFWWWHNLQYCSPYAMNAIKYLSFCPF